MTGWADTPGQEGLFVTAGNATRAAPQAADSAAAKGNGLAGMKTDIEKVMTAIVPAAGTPDGDRAAIQYGIKTAVIPSALDGQGFSIDGCDRRAGERNGIHDIAESGAVSMQGGYVSSWRIPPGSDTDVSAALLAGNWRDSGWEECQLPAPGIPAGDGPASDGQVTS